MMPTSLSSAELSPDAILAAIEDYHGLIVDLNLSLVVPPQSLADARWSLATKMHDAGLRPGDRVLIALGNGPLFIAAWAAILMRGGSPVLVHWETPPAELRRVALKFHVRFAVTELADEPAMQTVGAVAQTLDASAWARLVWSDFGGAVEPEDGRFLSLPGVPLHPTSGTTGVPKMAVRPAACALAETENYISTIGIEHRDRLMALAPMSHAYGYGWYVVTPLVTGADIVTVRRFSARQVFDACQEYGITILPAVGAILDTLTFGAGQRLHDPTRRVFTGGAPVSERTAENFERVAGTRPRPLYGATEAGGIAVAREGDRGAIGGRVGPPFDNVEIDIRRPEAESDLPDELGLVHVRSGSVMAGYLIDERLDTSVLVDGWFNTGDLGWIDEHGALHLRGRQAEVINVSGMKVLPGEVEEVIAAIPGVREVRVYAGTTQAGSKHVKAAVDAAADVDVPRIKAHCDEHLVYYKRPSRITLVDALPRLPNGKIDRHRLP